MMPTTVYSSEWSEFRTAPLSPSKLAHRGREILSKLTERGIRIPPSNRLDQAIRLIDHVNDHPEVIRRDDLDMAYKVREAHRTLWEAFVIVHTVYDRPRQRTWYSNDALASLLRGAETERQESVPHARSTQYELYVAASLILGGADVHQGEPDFQMLFYGDVVGIAAKRLRSTKLGALRDALRDASTQIANSTGTGFIALNLDSWLTGLATDSGVADLGADFNSRMQEAHASLFDFSTRDCLLGYFISAAWFDWDFSGPMPKLDFHLPQQFRCFTENDLAVQKARGFFEPLMARHRGALGPIVDLVARPSV